MGEETTQFASRFGLAVDLLGRFVRDADFRALRRRHADAELVAVVREALDAVAAVHETGTDAVKDWATRRAAVLAQIDAVRTALDAGGPGAEARAAARALVELVTKTR
jgi:hypothetical protein